jgi:hypothetical protein
MQTMQQTRSVHVPTVTLSALCGLLSVVLDASRLHCLRSTCGLSQSDEAELRKLEQEVLQDCEARAKLTTSGLSAMVARGARDVARHGLRSCALPSCGATEEHPKTYKLCGRCRGAAYCGAAHCAEVWKRHKREDGCLAPPY